MQFHSPYEEEEERRRQEDEDSARYDEDRKSKRDEEEKRREEEEDDRRREEEEEDDRRRDEDMERARRTEEKARAPTSTADAPKLKDWLTLRDYWYRDPSVAEFARELRVPLNILMAQLRAAGVEKTPVEGLSIEDRNMLLRSLRKRIRTRRPVLHLKRPIK